MLILIGLPIVVSFLVAVSAVLIQNMPKRTRTEYFVEAEPTQY